MTRVEVAEAISVLNRGGLVAIPTETVYGLAADARNELAVRQIFALKGRPSNHPLIVHVADVATARQWSSHFSEKAEALAKAFWPGPLTLIVKRSALATDAVTGGQDTVGLRVPNHPLTLELLREFGSGVAAPSANRYGKISPTTAAHVVSEFGKDLELVLDGGPSSVGVESTIVDLSTDQPRLLRPGGISREAIERVLGESVPLISEATDIRVPGQVQSHYAPRAGLLLIDADKITLEAQQYFDQGARVAVIAPAQTHLPRGVKRFDISSDVDVMARELYAVLRRADASGVDLILASLPGEAGAGLAVRDRLMRAAAPRK